MTVWGIFQIAFSTVISATDFSAQLKFFCSFILQQVFFSDWNHFISTL